MTAIQVTNVSLVLSPKHGIRNAVKDQQHFVKRIDQAARRIAVV
jgi:hypothetical protein